MIGRTAASRLCVGHEQDRTGALALLEGVGCVDQPGLHRARPVPFDDVVVERRLEEVGVVLPVVE
jgi:hypothetical protein